MRSAIAEATGGPEDADKHGANWKGGEANAYALACAVKAFSTAMRAEGAPVSDFTGLKLPRPAERMQPRVTPEEFRALEQAALHRLMTSRAPRYIVARDLALLSFMADTGLRAAELCALNVEDLDLEQGVVNVQRGKGAKPRALNITDPDPSERDGGPTMRALRDYLEHRNQTFGRTSRQRALWLTRRGRRLTPDQLRKELLVLCGEAGIDGNRPPHAFRRGYFSAEYRTRPTSLPVLRARMGWSPKSHSMVEIYARGAEIDLAREQTVPSVAKRWRRGPDRRTSGREPAQRQSTLDAILALLQSDPGLSQALVDALGARNGA